MQTVRNSHIIRHTLRHYLAAAIFAGIIIQLNCILDSMVAGQFIGADAVSVIVLAMPLVNILMLPGTILLMGATLLIAPAFGNQDYIRVNRILSLDRGGQVLRQTGAAKAAVVGIDERVASADARIEQPRLAQLVVIDAVCLRQIKELVAERDLRR